MSESLLGIGLFIAGLALVAGLYHMVRNSTTIESLPESLQLFSKSRIQYGLAGLLLGAISPPALQETFDAGVGLSLVFFGGWFGLAAGCGLDLRVLRRGAVMPLLFEGIQGALVVGLVLLAFYLPGKLVEEGGVAISDPALLVICGICVLGGQTQTATEMRNLVRQDPWQASLTPFLGIFLVGLGSSQVYVASFQIDYPFWAMGKSIVVEGVLEELFWSLLLGGLIGIVGDLLIRDVEGDALIYLLTGVLLLGSGMAAGLGLDPLWVGLVSGMWLINATLLRLDILGILRRGKGGARTALLFLAGWLLGSGLVRFQMDVEMFFWVLLLLLILRPVARLGGLIVADRFWGRRGFKPANKRSGDWLIPDELALIIAAGLTKIIPAPAGLAVLAAVLASYTILQLAGGKVENLLIRFSAIAAPATGPTDHKISRAGSSTT